MVASVAPERLLGRWCSPILPNLPIFAILPIIPILPTLPILTILTILSILSFAQTVSCLSPSPLPVGMRREVVGLYAWGPRGGPRCGQLWCGGQFWRVCFLGGQRKVEGFGLAGLVWVSQIVLHVRISLGRG